jgi:hypothetical protein
MKTLSITNLDKLKGKKIRATYRTDSLEVDDSLVGKFTVCRVEDQEDWIWILGQLHTHSGATGNTHIHFRLYKEILGPGQFRVVKRYEFESTFTFLGENFMGEDWEYYIPIFDLRSTDALCASLGTAWWGWSKYVVLPTPPLSYKFGQP